ncbi:temptin-like [Littorina saxatilis]|uniref:temptin-like n=1 Tax=Littorina saxatilis TaxID=31220 RepID=UPI0038B4615B
MMMRSVVVAVVMMVVAVWSYPEYRDYIPNGNNVLNPCDATIWIGVGHENPMGGGQRNPFGLDFAAAGHLWTRALCMKDSDGDGQTNGYELGDASCNWNASDPNAHVDDVKGHPGRCLACTHSPMKS